MLRVYIWVPFYTPGKQTQRDQIPHRGKNRDLIAIVDERSLSLDL